MGVRHLTGDKMVDLSAVVLVVGQAFIHLVARKAFQTPWHGIHSLSIVEQPNDVVDSDTAVFDAGVTATNTGSFRVSSKEFVGELGFGQLSKDVE